MDVKIIHLYPDLMNLYGSYANVSAVKRLLERLGHSVTVETVAPGQDASLSAADFLFLGAGTERRRSRGRHISGGGVARLFYLPDLSAAPSLWGIRRPDLHRPAGYPAPDGDEDGLQ